MNDRPEKWMPAAVLAYWVLGFQVIPTFMPLIADGLWDNLQFSSWLDFIYHAINAFVVVVMFKTYAWESFLNVQLDTGKFFKTVGVALLLMLVLALGLRLKVGDDVFNAYPINEMSVAVTSGVMVDQLPVFGTLCHVLLTPIAVVGLFYTVGFAPMCCRKTWLGYLVVTVVILIPNILDVLWRGHTELAATIILLQLPMHWIACWTYQKADTVWAPLATLSVFNLITSLPCIFLQ